MGRLTTIADIVVDVVSATIQARGADKLGWCEAHDDDYCPPSPGTEAGIGAGEVEGGRERKRQKKDKSAGGRCGGGRRTRVLEVGAGCGLLGLVLSRLGCDVTLTEVPEALQNLKLNVKANMEDSEEGEERRARAVQLDWTSDSDVMAVGKGMEAGYDVVVGTDVVFSKALVDPLLRCIHSLSGPHTTVWLCLNERCRDAHAELLNRASLFFDLVDRSEQLRETDGCSSAEELELFLFRLTGRKKSPPPPPPSPPAKK